MKKIFGLLFILLVLAISAPVMANEDYVTLINKGEVVSTINAVIKRNNDYYISLDDLSLINVGYRKYNETYYGLCQQNGPDMCFFDTTTSELEYEYIFENAVIVENDIIYISLGCLTEIFSVYKGTNIDTENDILTVWINDYNTSTVWVTYIIDNSIPIGDDGLDAILYKGIKRSVGYGGASVEVPESYEGKDLTNYPLKTDVYNMGSFHTLKSTESHTFYNNSRSYTIHYDQAVNQGFVPGGISGGTTSSGGGILGGTSGVRIGYGTAGIKIDKDSYIGGTYKIVDEKETEKTIILTADDCSECVVVNGSITVPVHTEDIEYTVIAEAKGNDVSDFVDLYSGMISADESTSSYKLKLIPNQDYKVYVRFGKGEYVRQSVIIENLTSDKVVDFNDFEASNEITGKIKLPSDVTALTDLYNNNIEKVYARITLQASSEPHYIVDREEVEIIVANGYGEFILRDDIRIEKGLVSFRISEDIKEIYVGGVYYDNSAIKYIAEEGKPVSTNTKDIVLNIAKGKNIIIDVKRDVDSKIELYLNIPRNETEAVKKDCPLYVRGCQTDSLYNEENYIRTLRYTFVVPHEITKYIPYMRDDLIYEEKIYLNENSEWVFNIENVSVFTADNIITKYSGYDPPMPIEITYTGKASDNSNEYNYYVNSSFDYDSTIYTVYYGKNNKLLHIETKEQIFKGNRNHVLYHIFNSEYEPLAETIKIFVWTDKLRPLSNTVIIKSTE